MPKDKISLEKEINDNYKSINDIGFVINKKYKKTQIDKNTENRTLIVYNGETKNKLLQFHYTFIGSYDTDKSIWCWSHNNFTLDSKERLFKNKIDKTIKYIAMIITIP